jgi:uncharacterized protein
MTHDAVKKWSAIFDAKALELYPATDPSHDVMHIHRVVHAALRLAESEGADINVVLPAAYFHDFVNVPKDDPRRKEASRLSAEAAAEYLSGIGYPAQYLDAIKHAIAAHSFSANIAPETLEAKVVQDADRLDGLGAIGIARCFSTSTLMRRPYYCLDDVWAEAREYDDRAYAIDHFPVKLFKVAETMQTKAARAEARKRADFMRAYLEQLKSEI